MNIRTISFILTFFILLILLFAGLFILYLHLSRFQPAPVEKIHVSGPGNATPLPGREFSFLTWNIGYSGLGRDMDFFYEGGTRVRPEEPEFHACFDEILEMMHRNDTLDFLLVQEVDQWAKRSYFTDEVRGIAAKLPGYSCAFARNYDCQFVPVPLSSPMGRVVSGIATFSKASPTEAIRIDHDSRFSWPKQLVMLRRCLLVTRFPLSGGKELIVINTHHSAYDPAGNMRRMELQKLMKLADTEYQHGNYVIIGGDWNSNPRGFHPDSIRSGDRTKAIPPPIQEDFLPGWTFAWDPSWPTNRDVDGPYRKGKTITTIIDFFVTSPNVVTLSVQTIPISFSSADHQPVILKVSLR